MTSIKNSHENIQGLLVGTWDSTKASMLALGFKKFLLSFLLMKNEIETWAALRPGLCVHAMKSCHQQNQWASYLLFLKKTWQRPDALPLCIIYFLGGLVFSNSSKVTSGRNCLLQGHQQGKELPYKEIKVQGNSQHLEPNQQKPVAIFRRFSRWDI